MERQKLANVAVLFTNAREIGFPSGWFDLALCGFMGWDDCFDFHRFEFTRSDTKASEVRRVLREGGRFVCYSWEGQEDVTWMEQAMLRYYPEILQDRSYLQQRPIGMGYENARGYEIIFRAAGFKDIDISTEAAVFVSTDEEEWWRQMVNLGWDEFFDRINKDHPDKLQEVKQAIFTDLQQFKQPDGIYFTKSAFYVSGVK